VPLTDAPAAIRRAAPASVPASTIVMTNAK
jgi:hypothetical protein